MTVPVDVTYRFPHAFPASAALEQLIHEWVSRLEHAYDRIERCSVVVEMPHRHQRRGNAFHVRIELVVPDKTISVSHDPGDDHQDALRTVADAFRAARRQLLDYAQIQHEVFKRERATA